MIYDTQSGFEGRGRGRKKRKRSPAKENPNSKTQNKLEDVLNLATPPKKHTKKQIVRAEMQLHKPAPVHFVKKSPKKDMTGLPICRVQSFESKLSN